MTAGNPQAIINAHIFTGEALLNDHALIFENGLIKALLPQSQLPGSVAIADDLADHCLIPGFIDLQVNGGGGQLFNDQPTLETIRAIGKAHRPFGTTGFLPTLITDSFEVMRRAIAAVDQAMREGVPGVLGIHLEGPFLNAEKRGIHDAAKFCLLDDEGIGIVTSLGSGKTLLTLAPELTSPALLRRLSDSGVILSAGHSTAGYQQTCDALAAGIRGFTHLYNAMTPMQSREPGMVGAALADKNSWFGIIADGHHVHPATFKAAVAAKQRGGAILVTDAMPTVGSATTSFLLNGEIIRAIDGYCVNVDGVLAGSDLNMITAVNNTAQFAQIDWFEAVRMASCYPAGALGLDHRLGYLKPGYVANVLAVDERRKVIKTWIQGEPG